MKRRPRPLTREESLLLDEQLAPAQARRVERSVVADPDAAARVRGWRAAMSIWREDVWRAARAVDPDALTAAVLEKREADATLDPARERAPRRWAVAALVLLGLGLAGLASLPARPRAPGSLHPSAPQGALGLVERHRLDVEGDMVLEVLASPARFTGVPR